MHLSIHKLLYTRQVFCEYNLHLISFVYLRKLCSSRKVNNAVSQPIQATYPQEELLVTAARVAVAPS